MTSFGYKHSAMDADKTTVVNEAYITIIVTLVVVYIKHTGRRQERKFCARPERHESEDFMKEDDQKLHNM